MRSHRCGEVNEALETQRVTLCGWADRRRDHGGVIFVDLRDHTGVVQVVVQPDQESAFQVGEAIRMEFCLRVSGEVRLRPEGQRNEKLATGAIEVVIDALEILNAAPPLPFVLDEEAGEEIRLTHRYLDLRRPPLQKAIRTRAALVRAIRDYLEQREFIDIETPILTRATPEGARDYLVPSRNHPGEFYALPQSPQIFKQILMMSGMDRYYQIARCFRDEDLRADRQPEFTQLDVEMAFVELEDVLDLAESLVRGVMSGLGVAELPEFPRITYTEAIRRFGSDKPDLRNPLELTDIAEHLVDSDFKVFAGPAKDPAGRVAVLKVPGGKSLTRKQIDDYAPFVARYGAKGLAWIKVNELAAGREGLQSPIVKFLSDAEIAAILEATQAADGDLLFFGAGPYGVVSDFMGALRLKVGVDLELTSSDWRPLWVVDFPMFEWDERRQRWSALHHPFTAPVSDDAGALAAEPGNALSKGYDLVLNGVELGGGSIRIHRDDMQSSVFQVLGIEPEQAQTRFGFLLEALRYGCPPHGGIAFGIDRWAALIVGTDSIRDVIAFPKTASASCLMTQAPSVVDLDQLRELHLSVVKPPGS